MAELQGHSPSHSQLGGSILCVTPRAHQSVPVPTRWSWKHLLPVGHSAAVGQPLSTGWLVSEWLLQLVTFRKWTYLCQQVVLNRISTWCAFNCLILSSQRCKCFLGMSWGWSVSVQGWVLSLLGWSGELPPRIPLYLATSFLLRMQRLLPHAACPDGGRRKVSPKKKDQSGDVGSRCPSPGSAMN